MKVLFISEYFPPNSKGGGERSAYKLARALAKKGVTVHVLTSHFSGPHIQIVDDIQIFRYLKTAENPGNVLKRLLIFERSLLRETEKLHKQEKYDVIHCKNSSSVYAVKLKKKLNVRFVMHINSYALLCPKGTMIYHDQTIRRECFIKCNGFYEFLSCFARSKLVGINEMPWYHKLNPLVGTILWWRYKQHLSLLKQFDKIIPISKITKRHCVGRGLDEKKMTVIYPIHEIDGTLLKQHSL